MQTNRKVVIITGASSGIGKAIAMNLVMQEKYIVYALARRINLMSDIKKNGGIIIAVDVTNFQMVEKVILKIIKKEKKINILINNAGMGILAPFEHINIQDGIKQYNVNVFGLAFLCKICAKYMRLQKEGTIINVSSIVGKMGFPYGSWYNSSKFAVEGMSDCLRMELKPFNINVVIIEPGGIKTDFWTAEKKLKSNVKISKNSPYAKKYDKYQQSTKKMKQKFPTPEVIVKIVNKVLNVKHPKSRYKAGKGARILLTLRKMSSDKIFDFIIKSCL